jgi:adenosylmethionine-8-amino-7-oxononanoate aminotransferase
VQVRPPAGACPATEGQQFDSLDALFSDKRLDSPLAAHYEESVAAALRQHESETRAEVGACLMEPVMQAAGGMVFVDPLFQKVIASVRSRFTEAHLECSLQCRISTH